MAMAGDVCGVGKGDGYASRGQRLVILAGEMAMRAEVAGLTMTEVQERCGG